MEVNNARLTFVMDIDSDANVGVTFGTDTAISQLRGTSTPFRHLITENSHCAILKAEMFAYRHFED